MKAVLGNGKTLTDGVVDEIAKSLDGNGEISYE